jgi:hypothetical protein
MALALWFRPVEADDFAPFYRAAVLASSHSSVYANPSWSPEKEAEGRFLPYIRIPSYAEALRPLAKLPYAVARRVWITSLILAALGCVWLCQAERNRLAVALAYSFPLADALMIGQDICFVLLIVLAAARIYAGGRQFLAGLAASLLAVKITYLPAAGIVFLAQSRRGAWGLITGTAIQLAVSFAVGGVGWPAEYLALLRSPLLDPEPGRMLNIRAIAVLLSLPAAVYIIAGAALYAGFWFVCRRLSVADGLTLALALGVIASPHCKVYDGIVLIPLFVRVASLANWEGLLAYFGLTPSIYLMSLMGTARLTLGGSSLAVICTLAAALRMYRMREVPEAGPVPSQAAGATTV